MFCNAPNSVLHLVHAQDSCREEQLHFLWKPFFKARLILNRFDRRRFIAGHACIGTVHWGCGIGCFGKLGNARVWMGLGRRLARYERGASSVLEREAAEIDKLFHVYLCTSFISSGSRLLFVAALWLKKFDSCRRMIMLFEKRQPKLPYFGTFLVNCDVKDENDAVRDHADRLPHTLVVRDFDIFCFLFSAASYLADICSDVTAAYIHYREQRMWAFVFIVILIVLPSVMLNVVSFMWWFDDVSARAVQHSSDPDYSKQLLFRIVVGLLQIGPVVWYLEAALAAVKFRMTEKRNEKLRLYAVMVEAERDASLLRFFEAFLESAPQMLVQGVALVQTFHSVKPANAVPKWMVIQVVSISFSLLSSCWAFVIQHRSLRICRPDKENITPTGTLMQLLWRMCTVSSRYICFVLFILTYQCWILVVFGAHFLVSLAHIAALQPLEIGSNKPMEVGLIAVCAAVHLFAPYNMAEGRSRYRYIVAYCIEAVETAVLLNMIIGYDHCSLPYKWCIATGICLLFLLGISFMLIYYGRFHPNIVRYDTRDVSTSCVSSHKMASASLNGTVEET